VHEASLAENVAARERRRLRPRVLVDVARVTTATTLLGAPSRCPLAIAPMAAQGELHPDGELAIARRGGVRRADARPRSRPARSRRAVAAPEATRWFPLYIEADARRTRTTVERAVAAGYAALW
jgi:isopentenyl diphosphate isomerase/L-lactate dehydrogenase-like FMN-dependent dehydrogenase